MRLSILFLFCVSICYGQGTVDSVEVKLLQGEYWWGGTVWDSDQSPYRDGYSADLWANTKYNQAQPLLLSSKGRIIWSESPFRFSFKDNALVVVPGKSKIIQRTSGTTLREAYSMASREFFPAGGTMPDPLLFSRPQYNTWIELTYNQNEKDILKYAKSVLDNGFPAGVLMIDDNWQRDYGTWDFDPGKFDDPKKMVETLHSAGFKVMLWICPFVSADSEIFRALKAANLLLMDSTVNQPAIIRWWNGASAVLDFSNPQAVTWFRERLSYLQQKYGIDGFKFDAGDAYFYDGPFRSFVPGITPNEHSELFAKTGLEYPLNEYRATWKMGGEPLAQRLADKEHSWPALKKLIPQITAQGLMGYPFTCPDMIGGGEFLSFLDSTKMDQDLVVRSAQCHALMPMMQFSVAPWRVLDAGHLAAVKAAVELRMKYTPTIMELTKAAAHNGMPVVRSMEFVFPGQGYQTVVDQFLLGDDILVAPILDKSNERKVLIPKGTWRADDGKLFKGPRQVSIKAPLDRLPYFTKVK